jgi:hypothetical protein
MEIVAAVYMLCRKIGSLRSNLEGAIPKDDTRAFIHPTSPNCVENSIFWLVINGREKIHQ